MEGLASWFVLIIVVAFAMGYIFGKDSVKRH